MGVQARPFSMPEHNVSKSPSMMSATSPLARKRRRTNAVPVDSEDTEDDDAELTHRISFKRSKAGDTELHVQVRDGASSTPSSPKTTGAKSKTSPSSSKSGATRPNMSASQTITLNMLRPHFEKPLAQVAQVFGICVTLLKKICRKNGLARWPHRQIIGLRKSISSMEQAIGHFEGARRESYAQQLDKQRNKLAALLEDPTKCNLLAVDDEYLPSSTPVEDDEHEQVHVRTPAAIPTQTQTYTQPAAPYNMSSYDSYAPMPSYETPSLERHNASYAPQANYYHQPAPTPTPARSQFVAYPAQHFYPTAYYHQPTAPRAPTMMLPPLRTDTRPALPPLAALMGRRW